MEAVRAFWFSISGSSAARLPGCRGVPALGKPGHAGVAQSLPVNPALQAQSPSMHVP